MNTWQSLKWPLLVAWLIVMLACCAGCVRTIYVPHGTPVRLRETVDDVKVWVKDANGKTVAGIMDLREGWYALSADGGEE